MKKLFVCLAMAVTMFALGITLSACGSDVVKLTFSVEQESEPLVRVVVKQDNKEIEGRGYNYNLQKGLNLRVEIVAKEYGVDFSQLVVKVNGQNKSIIANRDYDCSMESENLVYGNFTLANIDEKLNISIEGVRQMSIAYKFEVENAEDETAIANMQNAFIDVQGNGQYQNFYSFVTNPDSRLERTFNDDNFNSFNLRFADPETGDDIFNLYGTDAIKIRSASGVVSSASYAFTSNGDNIVSFSNVKEKEYTIVVDFKDLTYKEYSVIKPQDNLNYSVEAPVSINYVTEGVVTVKKSDKRDSLVYDNVKVYLNDRLLELAPDCDLQNDTNLRFVVPKGITPFSTSQYGEAYYTIRVEGISYNDESYDVNIAQSEGVQEQSILNTKLFLLDSEGERVGEIPEENGKYVVAKGEKVALFWEYKYDEEIGTLVSRYNLYDFDIVVGDKILTDVGGDEPVTVAEGEDEGKTENPNPNPEGPELPEEPDVPQEQVIETILSLVDKIDLTLKENQTIAFEDGYVLRVYFNEERQVFDSMQLEFSSENAKEFRFENFTNFAQEMNISYDFESDVINAVEYYVEISSDVEWLPLEFATDKKIRVEAGQKIVLRLCGDAYVEGADFTLENMNVVVGQPEVSKVSQDGVYYTELRYVISDNQFEEIQNFKLIDARG